MPARKPAAAPASPAPPAPPAAAKVNLLPPRQSIASSRRRPDLPAIELPTPRLRRDLELIRLSRPYQMLPLASSKADFKRMPRCRLWTGQKWRIKTGEEKKKESVNA